MQKGVTDQQEKELVDQKVVYQNTPPGTDFRKQIIGQVGEDKAFKVFMGKLLSENLPFKMDYDYSQLHFDFKVWSTFAGGGITMTDVNDLSNRVDHLNVDLHKVESRLDQRVDDLKDNLIEVRRDTREELREMRSIVKHLESAVTDVRNSNRHIVIAIVFGSLGVGLAVFYGNYTIHSALTSMLQFIIQGVPK